MNPDTLLLSYISFFGVLCAVLIIKKERLGWAFFAKNLSYALAFGYGAWASGHPGALNEDTRRIIRVMVALAITWAIFELVVLRVRRWREAKGT